ncbi:MAG TPA: PKD domain-containing protein [Crocinitomicaceae bacterium]|nr:PKD domain-containing protein [Crocinitomicaceae bacterium]
MLKSIKAFLVTMFFGASANAASVDPVKILFIGNSYTHMNEMPKMLQKMVDKAGKEVIIERNTESGGSFEIHSKRPDLYQAINKRKWDYVILQGFSREMSYSKEHIDSASVPFLNQITDSIYANNACTNVLFYMTWGYDEGFLDREEINSYEKMADSIERGYSYLGEVYNVPVVPVGMVWKQVKKVGTIDLYAPDRAHPSRKGSYLIATTFYNAIFGESNENVYTSTIASEDAELIKKEAKNFIDANREKYHLTKNRFLLESFVTDKGEYKLNFFSSFAEDVALLWSFGDGQESTTKSGTHTFKKPGEYVIKLTVHDKCGNKSHERIVKFIKPKKKRRKKTK